MLSLHPFTFDLKIEARIKVSRDFLILKEKYLGVYSAGQDHNLDQ